LSDYPVSGFDESPELKVLAVSAVFSVVKCGFKAKACD